MQSDRNITNVFIVNSEAHLVALSVSRDTEEINESRLAELMEDLLFMISSRKHYEDLYDALQYLHIKHKTAETFVLPFERDMLLCICLRTSGYDEAKFLGKVQGMLPRIHEYVQS